MGKPTRKNKSKYNKTINKGVKRKKRGRGLFSKKEDCMRYIDGEYTCENVHETDKEAYEEDRCREYFYQINDKYYRCNRDHQTKKCKKLGGLWGNKQPCSDLELAARVANKESRWWEKFTAPAVPALPATSSAVSAPAATAAPTSAPARSASPTPSRASPTPSRASPTPSRASPKPRRASPKPRRASPMPRRASPKPRRASPMPPSSSRAPNSSNASNASLSSIQPNNERETKLQNLLNDHEEVENAINYYVDMQDSNGLTDTQIMELRNLYLKRSNITDQINKLRRNSMGGKKTKRYLSKKCRSKK